MIVASQRAHRARTQPGISLVELLVVLSGCSVVISMTGVLLHRAMRGESETRHMFDVEQAALRLSHQFRDDVHQAVEIQITTDSADGELLRVDLGQGRAVCYSHEGESVTRVLSGGKGPTSREEYRLGVAKEVAVSEQDKPRRISLTISSPSEPAGEKDQQRRAAEIRRAPLSLQLVAVEGRDARFAPLAPVEERSK